MLQRIKEVNRRDWILLIGLMLAPMTGLRIWKIGPAEALCLIWGFPFLREFFSTNLKNYKFKFWMMFLCVITLGAIYGTTFYPKETSLIGILTYVYLSIVFLSFSIGLSKKEFDDIDNLFVVFCFVTTLWYVFLYYYSRYSESFLGAQLWFGRHTRFTGGGTNPHQLAVCIGVVLFGNIRSFFRSSRSFFDRMVYVICILGGLFIVKCTRSSTLYASIAISFFVGILVLIVNRVSNVGKRRKIYIIIICALTIMVLFFHNVIYEAFMGWLSDDENGMGRLDIFKTYSYTFKKNAIIGLGPGKHAYNGVFEYHNTYLEILAMSGIVGLIIFAIFSIRIFQTISVDPFLILCIIPLYSYGLAGFSMRRLIYWGILAVVLALAEKIKKRKEI